MIAFLSRCLLLTGCLVLTMLPAAHSEAEGTTLQVLNYVTGWTLDAGGYHPAVFLLLENVCGRDLSGMTIKMQGRFTDIHTLEPSVAKIELRQTMKPLQQFPISIVAPQAYELPREITYWPRLECKVMMRAGTVGDEGTETLLVASIDPVTQTQEDAFRKLNEVTSYNKRHTKPVAGTPTARPPRGGREDASPAEPIKALAATPIKAAQPAQPAGPRTIKDLLQSKNLPGLGDDFYDFEQTFGIPVLTESKKREFTWAKFKHRTSNAEVIVCSKEMTGKADMVIMQIPKSMFKSEDEMFRDTRAFAGKFKGQAAAKPTKSVRYLSSGRLEVTTSQATTYRTVVMSTPENGAGESSYIVILTRLPQEASGMLLEQVSQNPVLKGLPVVQP